MAFLDTTVVNVALPHLGRDLHATVDGLQWTITGYTLTLSAFVLLGGALGDRYGRRRVFSRGSRVVRALVCPLWTVVVGRGTRRGPGPAGLRRGAAGPGLARARLVLVRRAGPRPGDRCLVGPIRRVDRRGAVPGRLADRRAVLALDLLPPRAGGCGRRRPGRTLRAGNSWWTRKALRSRGCAAGRAGPRRYHLWVDRPGVVARGGRRRRARRVRRGRAAPR